MSGQIGHEETKVWIEGIPDNYVLVDIWFEPYPIWEDGNTSDEMDNGDEDE